MDNDGDAASDLTFEFRFTNTAKGLGVLPAQGASTRPLTAIQEAALADSSQVAVSIEPPCGSPTGQPTGEVVFAAPLRASS